MMAPCPRGKSTIMKRYKGLAEGQFDALSSIAFGNDGAHCHPKTLEALAKKGLIVEYEKKIYGKGTSPLDSIPLVVKAYYMPIPEHIEFCQWCADNE